MVTLALPPPEPAPENNSSSTLTTTSDSAPRALTASSGTPAASSSAPEAEARQELEWHDSLRNLEYRIETYREYRARQGAVPDEEVEQVAQAMEQAASSHPDPKVKDYWQERAGAFRNASPDDRDGILEDIGKGFLILLTTPFVLVGAVLQAVGGILSGVGSILKGLGGLAGKLKYASKSKSKKGPSVGSSPGSGR